MKELSSPKLHCKQQRLTCSPRSTNYHDRGWMLGCCHFAVFKYIIPKCYDPFILFAEDRNNSERIEKWRFDSRDSSGYSTNGCSSPDVSELMLPTLSREFLERLRLFLSFYWPSLTQWRLKISCSVPVLSFSGTDLFKGDFNYLLSYNLRFS